MKKISMFVLLILTLSICYSQDAYFVSSIGDDGNDGFSEMTSLKSLTEAYYRATKHRTGYYKEINKIIVIGTLNHTNQNRNYYNDYPYLFTFEYPYGLKDREILITGKLNSDESERAILSGIGWNHELIAVSGNARIRFENIEISDGEGIAGIIIASDAKLTLGDGAILKNNHGFGCCIVSGDLILDGGEINDNHFTGVYLANKKSKFLMYNGIITGNNLNNRSRAAINHYEKLGGGVWVREGNFIMSGGSINNNYTVIGSGVYIDKNGDFNQIGGEIINNYNSINMTGHNPNILK